MKTPANRAKPYCQSTFAALWNNHAITTARIARTMGITRQAVSSLAKTRGLPSRAHIRWRVITDEAAFRAMWEAGVRTGDIAAHFGCSEYHTAQSAARRMGLPSRTKGWARWHGITIAQYRELQLARSMATAARIEQAAMINAEMADAVGRRCRLVGAGQARAA